MSYCLDEIARYCIDSCEYIHNEKNGYYRFYEPSSTFIKLSDDREILETNMDTFEAEHCQETFFDEEDDFYYRERDDYMLSTKRKNKPPIKVYCLED